MKSGATARAAAAETTTKNQIYTGVNKHWAKSRYFHKRKENKVHSNNINSRISTEGAAQRKNKIKHNQTYFYNGKHCFNAVSIFMHVRYGCTACLQAAWQRQCTSFLHAHFDYLHKIILQFRSNRFACVCIHNRLPSKTIS